ncbi:MAG TPA: tRNA guanosine(34) transglycosylase Tgt, partial [Candidatus Paceibacterota bacterium]
MKFTIEKKLSGSLARAGKILTAHGVIETPTLIVAATKASVKALSSSDVLSVGGQAVLANTYHLYLQPGDEVIKRAGGLHRFMNWNRAIFTDSGGFQAFSLGEAFGTGISKFIGYENNAEYNPSQNPKRARVDDDGVTFYSHIDGSEHRFTPERSIEIQLNLGADIIFAFDECVSPHAPREAHEKAVERTRKWAERCIKAHRSLLAPSDVAHASMASRQVANGGPSLWGIVQGGRYEDLRRQSAREIGGMEFEGFGIGGSF